MPQETLQTEVQEEEMSPGYLTEEEVGWKIAEIMNKRGFIKKTTVAHLLSALMVGDRGTVEIPSVNYTTTTNR